MATMIPINCPHCKKENKGPAELLGKKLRCKNCGEIFTVQKAKGPAPKTPSAKPAKQAKPVKEGEAPVLALAPEEIEEEGPARPYAVTDLDLTPRCPHCANEIEEGAIICLFCGYNTQTRERFTTRKTIEHTGMDYFLWLLPGIVCVIVVLLCIGGIIYAWLKFDDHYKDNSSEWWVGAVFGMFAKIYSTVIELFIIYLAGKFAIKRLILHPTPPEKIVR
ncbi:MAG TPA: hypothetical protein VGZ25_11340 [Gemmataceae bacterium]|jgi:hypothetical protein|nr:hypothetical protein [Gemmataceae bacterium]